MKQKRIGRPPLPKSKKRSELVRLYMTPKEKRELEQIASERGHELPDAMREGVRLYLRRARA